MRQDQLDGLVTFVLAAELGSFTATASRLGISPSAVSQAIRSLEKRTGGVLFNRTTRSVRLTEPGRHFLERIRPMVLELACATDSFADTTAAPSGLLRLNVTTAAYHTVLQPVLADFLERYPQIDVEIALEDGRVDIVREGFDAGIRLHSEVERDLIAIAVGPELSMLAVASPCYLSRRGAPQHPRELQGHACIGFRRGSDGVLERWYFNNGSESIQLAIKGRLVSNNHSVMIQSVLDGQGIGYLASGDVEHLVRDGRLVNVLPGWGCDVLGYRLYFPNRRSLSRRLRLLIDHLKLNSMELT